MHVICHMPCMSYMLNMSYMTYLTCMALCMCVNMGVKRSVRTSGLQPTILHILQNCLYGQKLKNPDSTFFKKSFVYLK